VKVKRLDELRDNDVLTELNSLHATGVELVDPTEISGSLRGRQNLYNHLETMIKSAQKSVTLVTTAQGLVRKQEMLKPLLEQLQKRGVSVRIAVPATNESKKAAKELGDLADIRASTHNARFCVVDGKQLTFMITDDTTIHHNYDSGVWVHTPYFAQALEQIFDKAWTNMKPLK
jgi:phosphatidylserine/phosphatidylglycerophosphate/cardiolipin synthase-like enzyme